MNKDSKEFRSKYFYAARRTTLPKDVVEFSEKKYQQITQKRDENNENIGREPGE